MDQQTDTDTMIDFELSMEDIIVCEAAHRRSYDIECLHEATWRVGESCRGGSYNVCEHIVMVNRTYMAEGRHCAGCHGLADVCWFMEKL